MVTLKGSENNPGAAALTRLFTSSVRERGMQYVGHGAVRIVKRSPRELWAEVRGTRAYSTRFVARAQRLEFGCSCPYFMDRLEPCKHLFALLLEHADSEVVRGAANSRSFNPSPGVLDEPNSVEKVPDEARYELEEAEPDYEDEVAPEPNDEPNPVIRRLRAFTRTPDRDWRALAARATRDAAPEGERPFELVYFLVPSLDEDQTVVVVGARPFAGPPERLLPVSRNEGSRLAHAVDRELYGLLLGAGASGVGYYRGYNGSTGLLTSFTVRTVLARLIECGRCFVVPSGLQRERDREWFSFRSGQRVGERRRQELGFDFGKMLSWPLLIRKAGPAYQVAIAVSEPAKQTKSRRRYDLTVELFRDDERRPLGDVSFVHGEGLLLLGAELAECAPTEAAWLSAFIAARDESVQVSESELPEFVATVFGKGGVSGLSLPSSFERAPAQAPRPMLDLQAPKGRKVRGHLTFDYAGQHVPAEQSSPLIVEGTRVLERDSAAERQAKDLLTRLGFTGSVLNDARGGSDVNIAEPALPPALHALLTAGWHVQAEGRRYRAASGFDVRFESGIDWFEMKGSATFEGGQVPFPKLLAAIKQRRDVVRLSDGSVGLLPEEWLERWGTLAQLSPDNAESLRFSSRQLGLVSVLAAALPEGTLKSRGFSELQQKLATFESVEAAPAPRGFCGELRPYQEQGLGWLASLGRLGFGACLADDMGLGKTVQVLAYLLARKHEGAAGRSALIVVPRSLLSNWLDEAARFAPGLTILQHWGQERAREPEAFAGVDLVLTTYGTMRLDIGLLMRVEFDSVVLDEAQAIKNAASTTAKSAKLLRSHQRVAMSGTPVENHLGELWSLFEFLNPGLVHELRGLKRSLASPKPSPEALGLLRTLVRPFVLRRTKGEVARELPARVEQTLYVGLEADERRLYDELLRHYQASVTKKLDEVGAERATPHILEALLRLRQAACHPGLVDAGRRGEASAKVECLVERLRALRAEGHRALVFSQFTSLLAIVRERLVEEQIKFEYLDGKTRDRKARVERFQSDPEVFVFLISLKAGGVGLNLTAADYVFILDPWWNPAVEAQAIDRAHRIGQSRNVIAYRLLAKGTVEERVALLQEQKRDLVAGIMGDDRALSGRLTRGDLEALLSLEAAQA